MSTKPDLTIIIATFNAERLIEITLKSILNLKPKDNIEVIICNNNKGSSIKKIIDKYSSEMNILYFNNNDQGIYDAWNFGINHVNSNWISFLGAGDTLSNDYLIEFLNCKLFRHNIISFNTNIVDINKNLIRKLTGTYNKFEFKKYMSLPHVGLFHSTDLFKSNHFNTKFKYAADYEFFTRNIEKLNVYYINKSLVNMLNGGITSYSIIGLIETLQIKLIYKIRNKWLCYIDFTIALFKLPIRYILDKIRF